MPVDNQLYDRLSHTWWEDDGFLNFLRSALNPARVGFIERELSAHFPTLDGLTVLDVGCGGGLLSEELAERGCSVTGIDPSEGSLAAAREHAHRSELEIEYIRGVAEAIPVPDRSFDAVICCDVLEHVDSPRQAVIEAARVLRPGGLYLYDTINRTIRSKLLMVKLLQDWKATACMEPDLHDHRMFIRPREMGEYLRAAGLAPGPIVGLAPSVAPPRALRLMRACSTGRITYGDLGRGLRIGQSRDHSGLYAGTAAKPQPFS
jgi:2-polyprenyl-6-hydroxyphenyl methylase / 3-demethylubiquinone-9 3-methyltransferase